jgi:hypothetical protein
MTFANSDYNIQRIGTMAWVTYKQATKDASGKIVTESHEMRVLERSSGIWKIVALSSHHFVPKQ